MSTTKVETGSTYLHNSPSGAIERCVYALLEKAFKEQQKGKPPMLPLWLSPTQVRLIPLSEEFLVKVEEIADEIGKCDIRVDVDDRASTLQKRIREAETEWVPYVAVVGKREVESGMLSIRNRQTGGKMENMSLNELITKIRDESQRKTFQASAFA